MTRYRFALLPRVAILVIALSALAGTRAAHAIQIVPSIGLSQATDGDGENRSMVALAVRNGFLPRTQLEIQAGYRSETYSFAGQSFDLKTIPVTLSLWASPVPMLYAGGGIGAYMQAVEYGNNLYPASNQTQFGAHLGGGLHFPLAPVVALDLQGRYVMLGEKSNELTTGKFDPSFWTVSAGLAIGF
jgi:outer membrane protein with beta-barrel domain